MQAKMRLSFFTGNLCAALAPNGAVNTLQLAIEKPGKYAGLDTAIETVFQNAVKEAKADPSVVNPMTPEIQAKVIEACEIVIVSAR